MARMPDNRAEQAKEMFLSGKKLIEIARALNVPEGTVRSWKNRYRWGNDANATLQKPGRNVARKRGGQPGNKNAAGHGGTGPPGNKNAIKHGAYEHIYAEALPEEERAVFNSIPDTADLDAEIKVLRLKMARLLCRDEITTYDMFGEAYKRSITEAEREKGLLAVSAEIRKLVKAKKQIQLADLKAGIGGQDEQDDDGFIDALNGTAAEDWADEND